jgi:hypothetical protein
MAACGHLQALLLGGAVYISRDDLSVPVDKFREIHVVEQVHGDWHTFFQPDQRPGNRPVVSDRADRMILCDLDENGPDAYRHISVTGHLCRVGGIRGGRL